MAVNFNASTPAAVAGNTNVVFQTDGSGNISGYVPSSAPSVVSVNLATQSAAITATTLYAVPVSGAGLYQISWSAVVTTAATTSSTLGGTGGFQLVYNDGNTSGSATTPAPGAPAGGSNLAYSQTNQNNTVGTQASGVVIVNASASTNIQYQFGYTSVGGTAMVYALHIRVSYLG